MGYTHYWRRPKEIKKETFESIAKDTKKVLTYVQDSLLIDLGNWEGKKKPIVNNNEINFNGSIKQRIGVWTTNERISIPWPSPEASIRDIKADPIASKKDGKWFAGDLVSQRVAPIDDKTGCGLGDYESFVFSRTIETKDTLPPDGDDLYFACTKTAYRPYDLAVTAVLIIANHYCSKVKISSDGEEKDWVDGKILCNNLLGYGFGFELEL